MAALVSKIMRTGKLKSPAAVSAPATNNKESPGRNGMTTKPVSIKIIAKRRT
jgi:hypothetical protein